VNFSHAWSRVALLWITSVVRPPPPTAVRKFPLVVLMPWWGGEAPSKELTMVKVSQVLATVRLVSITSVVRPPPPIADR
jgi:hypothetical protein